MLASFEAFLAALFIGPQLLLTCAVVGVNLREASPAVLVVGVVVLEFDAVFVGPSAPLTKGGWPECLPSVLSIQN